MASPTRLPSLRRPPGSSRPVSMIEGPMANIPDLNTFAANFDSPQKTKRRSLLPQFAQTTSVDEEARSSSRESHSADGDGSRASEDARYSMDSNVRTAIDEERRIMPPPSKPARPVSMIPPRGSSQASKLPSARSHTRQESKGEPSGPDAARAQSLAALTGSTATAEASKAAPATAGLRRYGSTRLPQSPRVDGPMIPSRTTSAQTKSAGVKSSSRKLNERAPAASSGIINDESASTKLRLPVINALAASETSSDAPPATNSIASGSTTSRPRPTSQAGPPISPPRVSSRSRPISQIVPPSSKPVFNTYQQHYSPAKSALPKPPLPATKHSQKPSLTAEPDESLTSETVKQQIELLQLSLLHQASNKCSKDYDASAKRKLGKMHSKLRREYEGLRAEELVQQRAFNLTALDAWCPDTALLVENLQILSLVYSDLSTLMEEGSRHSDVVAMFELWMNEAESAESGSFIQPLPEDWRASHGSLLLKLRTIQRNLRVLPPMHADGEASGAGVLLRACKALVEDMSKELEVMVKLEKGVMAKEKSKVEEEVGEMMAGSNVNTNGSWTPAWQTVQ